MPLSTIDIQELTEQHTAVVRARIAMSETGRIPGWIGETYEALQAAGIEPAGMPFTRTISMDANGMEVEVGWPVASPFSGSGAAEAVRGSVLPAGPAAVASYFGPYEGIGPAYQAIEAWCAEHRRTLAGAPWESYYTDPTEEPDPAKWRTDIYFPLAS